MFPSDLSMVIFFLGSTYLFYSPADRLMSPLLFLLDPAEQGLRDIDGFLDLGVVPVEGEQALPDGDGLGEIPFRYSSRPVLIRLSRQAISYRRGWEERSSPRDNDWLQSPARDRELRLNFAIKPFRPTAQPVAGVVRAKPRAWKPDGPSIGIQVLPASME
jgi:hypothetical protein